MTVGGTEISVVNRSLKTKQIFWKAKEESSPSQRQ
jgi:hypothetical protein